MTLRLVPGTPPRDAAEELRRQEMEVGNVRTAGHSSQDLLRAYLRWAIDAERMLRNHFTSDSVSGLVFTPRYWALQTSGTTNWELVQSLVEAEIREQGERLTREKSLLDDAQRRWIRERLVVPDTSALIHGPKLWEWDVAADLGWGDNPIQIVLPMLVLDELDDLKEHTKEHTRHRARRTLNWLSEHLGSAQSFLVRRGLAVAGENGREARGDVQLDVLVDEPGHVRLPIADDEIVDRAAALASLAGRDVTFVTNDVSQAYRARLASLEVSTVAEPIYDVDLQAAAREAAKQKKAQDAADRRATQEAKRGTRRGSEDASSVPAPESAAEGAGAGG